MPGTRFTRTVLGVLAVSHLLIGAGTMTSTVLVPGFRPVWALWFALAAGCCAASAIAMGPRWSVPFAGAATITAYASRGMALLLSYMSSGTVSTSSVVVGVTAWLTLAFYAGVVFVKGVAPLASYVRNSTALET